MTGPKTDLAEQLRDATTDRALARVAMSDADDRWTAAVHAAIDGRVPAESIARLAGISRGRVYQISDTLRAGRDQETTP